MTEAEGVFHLKELPTHCELCFHPLEGQKPGLVGGLHLCPVCDSGIVAERLHFRGFHFSESVESGVAGDTGLGLMGGGAAAGESVTMLSSQVIMQRKLPLKASFYREQDGGSLLSLFKRELQVGDDMFDKAIYIESKRDEVTKRLLSSSGLQSAIMDVVFETRRLGISGHTISTHGLFLGVSVSPAIIRRALAVVAHYLDIYCQHLERSDDVAWP